jgi:site-specific recombinase XerD
MECVRLRVKDIDFGGRQITVRDGKGSKDRVTMLPTPLVDPLHRHLNRVKALHERDINEGYGCVYLPFALSRKYPQAEHEWMLLGHADVQTTMIYTHVLNKGGQGVKSPPEL